MRIQLIQNLIDFLRGKKKQDATISPRQINPGFSVNSIIYKELRENLNKIPFYSSDNAPSSQAEWLNNLNKLKKLILNENPNNFLQWDIIRYTMFVTNESGDYIETELNFLKNLPDWQNRYINAIRENIVGNPDPCGIYPASSCNLIHHAYSAAQFETTTKTQINNLDIVFEFGGGYGSMCRLFHNLGFNGKYIIFDLPAFSALQQYYLKTLGFPVINIDEFKKCEKGILCISDIEELKNILIKLNGSKRNLFLATWSISETPNHIRDSIIPLLNNFNLFLIAYQANFNEMNNIEYFNNFMASHSNIKWQNWSIDHIKGHNYLSGIKNSIY